MDSLLIPAKPEMLIEVVQARYRRGLLPYLYDNQYNPENRPRGKDLAEVILHPDMKVFGVFSGVIGWYPRPDEPNDLP